MASRSTRQVDDDEIEAVLRPIDEQTGLTVEALSERTGFEPRKVQLVLEVLMERGQITSTPDWEYRRSRRSEA